MAEKEVKVPDIGNFKDVEVIEVMVKAGDAVTKEQGLITLETDKAAMDVPAPWAGTVKAVKVKKGDKVSEGSLVLVMDAVEEAAAANAAAVPAKSAAPAAAKAAPMAQGPVPVATHRELPPINESGFGKAHAGPSVRKFARELGVDLSRVRGSGRKERITHEDVKAFVKAVMQGGIVAGGGLPKVPEVDFARFGTVEVKPLSRIKRI
ncbi:MAG TPA: biotin/lipoyl-containing protein, partial [Gammaproteobacteria bacterium]|nr:biotin/lipoyl-containing protein [Gammaproteobacteria bacterium]